MTKAPEIGIGRDGKTELWCEVEKRHTDGTIDFHVINGRWYGSITPAGTLSVNETKKQYPAVVLWAGKAAFGEADYNEAIAWIDAQVKKEIVA